MPRISAKKQDDLKHRRNAPLITPTDLGAAASRDIAGSLNAILADVFSLYMKTKNFHWHMSGAHFRDYHLLLDEQADQLYAMSLIETWIDETERRTWFLFESSRRGNSHN